jgi:hypothetical protein
MDVEEYCRPIRRLHVAAAFAGYAPTPHDADVTRRAPVRYYYCAGRRVCVR